MTKKNIIFLSVSLVLIILLGIGVSYSMWNVSVSQDTNNTAYTECFDLSITNKENNISLDNAYPISNDKGKSLTPYTFTVTNTCDITTQYNINLEVLSTSTLSSKFIDVMFEGNINLLSSYDPTDKVNTSSIESRKLTTGILKSRESKDYSLRLWIDYNTTLEDLNNEIKSFKSKIIVVGKPINYNGDTVFNFDYTGGEQTFVAPVSGTYKLETWGAQGGDGYDNFTTGGFGGYSNGVLHLNTNKMLYVNVGGQGFANKSKDENLTSYGGYNGGGNSSNVFLNKLVSGGGGSTHMAFVSGILSALKADNDKILIISGGGGGTSYASASQISNGGAGGGYKGNAGTTNRTDSWCKNNARCVPGTGGSQESKKDNDFGTGLSSGDGAGGGGGYYGGGGGGTVSGGGGSGYIGNFLLTNKTMYCYNCEESNGEGTKTISTTCSEETPTSYCAKKGNGYARITLVSID